MNYNKGQSRPNELIFHYSANLYKYCNVKFSKFAETKNKVMRHKTRDESQFRVHLYIRSVYHDSSVPPEQFLEGICARLSKFLPIASLQVCNPGKRFVDVSVGVQSDAAVISFIESGRRVMLPGETGNGVEHQIVLGDSFLTFYKARKEGRAEEGKDVPSDHHRSDHSSSSFYERKRERESRRRWHDRSEEEEMRVGFIWIFCVPIDCKEREVFSVLAEKGMRAKSYDWKIKEDMQYLQVELIEPINFRELDAMDVRVEKYPLLVIPRLQDQKNLNQHILKHELEINFEKDIDEVELIKLVSKIGGVLALIKDEFYGPKKYVAALNSTAKVGVLRQQLTRKYKNCHLQRPKYPLRLGRLQKCFTFTQMMENLTANQQQM